MALERFAALVRAYGVQPQRWPQAQRALFDRYAATPEGKRLLAEEEKTDRLLASYTVSAVPSSGLAARIQGIATQAPEILPPAWSRWFVRLSTFSCAACLIAGLLVGLHFGDWLFPATPADAAVRLLLFGTTPQLEVYDALLPQ